MKQKKQKKKSKVYSKKGLSGLIQKYSSLETKQNVGNTTIKSITEVATGAGVGSLLSASLGKNSPLAGLLLVFAGNYVGDSTHLLKTIGIGTIAHGIAKANDYDKMRDTKSRFQQLREDWKKTLRIPTKGKKSVVKPSNETPTSTPIELNTVEFDTSPEVSGPEFLYNLYEENATRVNYEKLDQDKIKDLD